MRILLDECVPRPLRREFVGHTISTIRDMGWAGKKNGELLALMAGAGFEVLLPWIRISGISRISRRRVSQSSS